MRVAMAVGDGLTEIGPVGGMVAGVMTACRADRSFVTGRPESIHLLSEQQVIKMLPSSITFSL